MGGSNADEGLKRKAKPVIRGAGEGSSTHF